jgi:hypothetical protein
MCREEPTWSDRAENLPQAKEISLCERSLPAAVRNAATDWSQLIVAQNADQSWQPRLLERFDHALISHPRAHELECAFASGEQLFRNICGELSIDLTESEVHHRTDLKVQSFAMMLATESPRERVVMTTVTLASHFIDDKIDDPLQFESRRLFSQYRGNISAFFDQWGQLGRLGHALARLTMDQEGYYRGMQRMLYGGLIAHAPCEQQSLLMEEFQQLSCQPVTEPLQRIIASLRPLCYSLTSKTVLEMFPLSNSDKDGNELRSLCFAPAVLLIDLPNEEKKGEMKYYGPAPSLEELRQMVSAAEAHLGKCTMDYRLFAEQFNFVISAFEPMLPIPLLQQYRKFGDRLAGFV